MSTSNMTAVHTLLQAIKWFNALLWNWRRLNFSHFNRMVQRKKKGLHIPSVTTYTVFEILVTRVRHMFIFLITALWFWNYSEHTPNYSQHGIFGYLEHGISVPVTDTPSVTTTSILEASYLILLEGGLRLSIRSLALAVIPSYWRATSRGCHTSTQGRSLQFCLLM